MRGALLVIGLLVLIVLVETGFFVLYVRSVLRKDEPRRLDNLESGYYKDEEPDYEGTTAQVDREAKDLNDLLERGGA